MKLDTTITRLADYGTKPLRIVAGAADLQAARAQPPRTTPAAYVVQSEQVSAPNKLALPGLSQRQSITVSVILAIENRRDPTGAQAHLDLDAITTHCDDALLLWVPHEGYEQITKANARLLGFVDQLLWWRADYRTAFTLRKLP